MQSLVKEGEGDKLREGWRNSICDLNTILANIQNRLNRYDHTRGTMYEDEPLETVFLFEVTQGLSTFVSKQLIR